MTEFISSLADVSTMWLVCLSFIFCLIPLAIVGGMVFGMHKLLRALPPIFEQAQDGVARLADGVDQLSDKVAAPFVAASARGRQVQRTLHSLYQVIRRKA